MKRLYKSWEVIVIFFCSLTPLFWLRGNEVILGHDSGFRINPFEYIQTIWFSWNHLNGFGTDLSGYKGFLIGQLPEALLTRLTHSLHWGQAFSFMVWFFIIGCSMYLCLRVLLPDRRYWIVRLLASLGYMYNLYLLQGWFITERAKFSLYAAIPLIFMICWRMLHDSYSLVKGSILISWILFLLNGGGSAPLYGGLLLVVGVVSFCDIAHGIFTHSGIKHAWRVIQMLVFICFFVICVNAYWIIPQLYQAINHYGFRLSSSGGISGIMAWESYVTTLANFANLLRLQGIPDWYENWLHPYASYYNHPILILMSFLPIMGFTYVLSRQDWWKEYKEKFPFLGTLMAVWLIAMIFTAGTHSPAGFLYAACLKYIPGFAIFRTSFYKFGSALWFSATILFSMSIAVIITKHMRSKILFGLATMLLFVGLIVYNNPYFSKNFFLWNPPFSTKMKVPDYVSEMISYINSTYAQQKPRILLVPPLDTSFHADGYEWGFWSLDLFPRLSLSASTIANDTDSPIVLALYEAIDEGNMKVFENLVAQTGITKLLWRDDVLYSDKITTGKNFFRMKNVLNEYDGAVVEKQFGKWTLYSLTRGNDIQKVRVVSAVAQAVVPEEFKSGVFGLEHLYAVPVIFSDTVSEKIHQMVQWNITSAICVYCDPSKLKEIEGMKTISKVNFLPDSPLYEFAKRKEERLLMSYRADPNAFINVNLGYGTKHLIEIANILAKESDNVEFLAELSFGYFKKRVTSATDTVRLLPEVEQNTQRLQLASYFRFYIRYLSDLEKKDIKGLLSKKFFGNAYRYIQTQIETVSRGAWVSEGSTKRYYISIPESGIYRLISPGNTFSELLFIDGKSSGINEVNLLNNGIHTLETVPADMARTNMIRISTSSADITLSHWSPYTFPIHYLSDKELYMFHLEYSIPVGEEIFIELRQDNDAPNKNGDLQSAFVVPLDANGKWHVIDKVIQPNQRVSSGSLLIYSVDPMGSMSTVNIKNLSLVNIKPENIYAIQHTDIQPSSTPRITWKEINPVMYRIHVENALSSYIILLNTQFDKGWKAYRVPSGIQLQDTFGAGVLTLWNKQPISHDLHVMMNGYANAWYLSDTGSYDIIILYIPHILFMVSVGITLFSFVGSFAVFFVLHRRKGYEKLSRLHKK